MEEQKKLGKKINALGGNPYRADGQLKATSTLSRDLKKLEQAGGCGCGVNKSNGSNKSNRSNQLNKQFQMGGDYKDLPEEALYKAATWRNEVNAYREQNNDVSYKDALKAVSNQRKTNNGSYKTMNQRYVENLDSIRKSDREYQPYGRKNKRPLSLEAAQRLLLQYYRQRADQSLVPPLNRLKKNISTCHKDEKRTLKPCPQGVISKKSAQSSAPECVKSWKFRPGKFAKGDTGPAYYDMEGVNNLCGSDKEEALKKSKLYNMKFMHKKKRSSENTKTEQTHLINPTTGRKIQSGGEVHKKLIAQRLL